MNIMTSELVSIVVPVYNSAPYLRRCITSLQNQTYDNIELIFVDDGSSDNSRDILLEERNKDKRITTIFQKNAGPSAARNAGMYIAKGEYIMFCDSDDEVATDWCQRMVSAIQQHPNSFVVCGFYRLDQDGNIIKEHMISGGRYEKSQYYLLYLPGLSGSACNKIYRSDIIQTHGLVFDESRKYAEDALFNLSYFEFTEEIYVIPKSCYYYYFYPQANTLSSNIDFFQLREIYLTRLKYISSQYTNDFKHSFWHNAWSKLQEAMYNKNQTVFMRIYISKRITRDGIFQELLSQFGSDCLDKKSFILLRHNFVVAYYFLQSVAKNVRLLKKRIENRLS